MQIRRNMCPLIKNTYFCIHTEILNAFYSVKAIHLKEEGSFGLVVLVVSLLLISSNNEMFWFIQPPIFLESVVLEMV